MRSTVILLLCVFLCALIVIGDAIDVKDLKKGPFPKNPAGKDGLKGVQQSGVFPDRMKAIRDGLEKQLQAAKKAGDETKVKVSVVAPKIVLEIQ
jgi:hypothetical protein